MDALEWNQCRSHFNHGWLKNRLIVSLYRAQRILEGTVLDGSGLEALRSLLAEWPEQRREAQLLLVGCSHCCNSVPAQAKNDSSFIATVALLRWKSAESQGEKVAEAEKALEDLDAEVRRITDLDRAAMQRLLRKAGALAEAFSALSVLNHVRD